MTSMKKLLFILLIIFIYGCTDKDEFDNRKLIIGKWQSYTEDTNNKPGIIYFTEEGYFLTSVPSSNSPEASDVYPIDKIFKFVENDVVNIYDIKSAYLYTLYIDKLTKDTLNFYPCIKTETNCTIKLYKR